MDADALTVKLLLASNTVLGGVIVVLFYHLIASKNNETRAYKAVSPLVQKLIEVCEKLSKGKSREKR